MQGYLELDQEIVWKSHFDAKEDAMNPWVPKMYCGQRRKARQRSPGYLGRAIRLGCPYDWTTTMRGRKISKELFYKE